MMVAAYEMSDQRHGVERRPLRTILRQSKRGKERKKTQSAFECNSLYLGSSSSKTLLPETRSALPPIKNGVYGSPFTKNGGR